MECGVRMGKGGVSWCVCARRQGRSRLAGVTTPRLSLSPVPLPAFQTCVWVVPAMVEQRVVPCAEGVLQ